jgi:hypothetical protein
MQTVESEYVVLVVPRIDILMAAAVRMSVK